MNYLIQRVFRHRMEPEIPPTSASLWHTFQVVTCFQFSRLTPVWGTQAQHYLYPHLLSCNRTVTAGEPKQGRSGDETGDNDPDRGLLVPASQHNISCGASQDSHPGARRRDWLRGPPVSAPGDSGRVSLANFPNREDHPEPAVGQIPWRREWLHTPVFLPGDSHG